MEIKGIDNGQIPFRKREKVVIGKQCAASFLDGERVSYIRSTEIVEGTDVEDYYPLTYYPS